MTSFSGKSYTWLPMPHTVSVECPDCGGHSEFTFSRSYSPNKKDRPYFEKSKSFQTERIMSHSGWKYSAWYDPGLGQKNIDIIQDLPEGVSKTDFLPSRYYTRDNTSRGVVICGSCSYRRLHKLSWPNDAYFKVEYKGNLLWAFNREMGLKILSYLSSEDRKKRIVSTTGYISQHAWLRKIPTVFQTKKARSEVVAKLQKILL